MRRVRGVAAGAVLAATGLVTAACMQGGGTAAGSRPLSTAPSSASSPSSTANSVPGSAADAQAVAAALPRTKAAGSARISTSTELGTGGQNVPVNAAGTVGFANKSADLTENLPGGQGSGETRFVNGVLYERLPGDLISRLSGGKPWISLDVTKLSQQGGGSLQQLMTDSPSDPTQMLGFLQGVGSASKVGPDTVDGVPTTHYNVTIDLDKASARQSGAGKQAIQTLEDEIGSHSLPAQVWIDNQGRLRKITMQETLSGMPATTDAHGTDQSSAPSTGHVSFSFTATLSDFGVPVTVTAPPADQVADLTQKLSGGTH
jgi:hypothetical protein